MSRAQEIRKARLEKMDGVYEQEARKIFDWILNIFSYDMSKNVFDPVAVYLYYDETSIMSEEYEDQYDLEEFLSLHDDRKKLFEKLKNIVGQEEGYKVTLQLNAKIWEEPAIYLEIDIV